MKRMMIAVSSVAVPLVWIVGTAAQADEGENVFLACLATSEPAPRTTIFYVSDVVEYKHRFGNDAANKRLAVQKRFLDGMIAAGIPIRKNPSGPQGLAIDCRGGSREAAERYFAKIGEGTSDYSGTTKWMRAPLPQGWAGTATERGLTDDYSRKEAVIVGTSSSGSQSPGRKPMPSATDGESEAEQEAREDAERQRVAEAEARLRAHNAANDAAWRAKQQKYENERAAHQRQVDAAQRAQQQFEAELARNRQAQDEYRRKAEEHKRVLATGNFQPAPPSDGNCKMANEANASNIYATEAEAANAARTRGLPMGATNLGAPKCEWVNFVLDQTDKSTPIPGRRGYRCSVTYQRNICYGYPASARQQ